MDVSAVARFRGLGLLFRDWFPRAYAPRLMLARLAPQANLLILKVHVKGKQNENCNLARSSFTWANLRRVWPKWLLEFSQHGADADEFPVDHGQ